MSVGLESGTYRNSFERTPEERVHSFVKKILEVIDDPLACKDPESGRGKAINIAYIERARDSMDIVKNGLLLAITELSACPESRCILLDGTYADDRTPDTRPIIFSTLGGNILFEEAITDPSGELWGHQYWVNNTGR